jgi:murein tripeptide amidase MpaA
MNPDGFEASSTHNCGENANSRENANHIDLNRNFPDQFGRTEGSLQPETKVWLFGSIVCLARLWHYFYF